MRRMFLLNALLHFIFFSAFFFSIFNNNNSSYPVRRFYEIHIFQLPYSSLAHKKIHWMVNGLNSMCDRVVGLRTIHMHKNNIIRCPNAVSWRTGRYLYRSGGRIDARWTIWPSLIENITEMKSICMYTRRVS